MNPIKTLAVASIAVAMSSDLAAAWDASVTFYEHAYFSGASYRVNFAGANSNTCFTLSCFKDIASSATWQGIPASNAIGGNIHIEFFPDANCGGQVKRWKSTDNHPNNFAVDGINDQISSFMIAELYFPIDGFYTLPCSTSTNVEESGQLSYITVVNETEVSALVKAQKANATAVHVIN